jgi:hypothetical protein
MIHCMEATIQVRNQYTLLVGMSSLVIRTSAIGDVLALSILMTFCFAELDISLPAEHVFRIERRPVKIRLAGRDKKWRFGHKCPMD